MPTKTKEQVLAEVDQSSALTLEIAALEAQRDVAVSSVLEQFNPEIAAKKKSLSALKSKVRRWLTSHSKKLFTKKGSGEYRTPVSLLSWKQNPEKIEPINKDSDEEQLAARLLKMEGPQAVRTIQVPDKAWLKKQDDEKLKFLGWKRTTGHTLKVSPLAKATGDKKETANA